MRVMIQFPRKKNSVNLVSQAILKSRIIPKMSRIQAEIMKQTYSLKVL